MYDRYCNGQQHNQGGVSMEFYIEFAVTLFGGARKYQYTSKTILFLFDILIWFQFCLVPHLKIAVVNVDAPNEDANTTKRLERIWAFTTALSIFGIPTNIYTVGPAPAALYNKFTKRVTIETGWVFILLSLLFLFFVSPHDLTTPIFKVFEEEFSQEWPNPVRRTVL